jgi:molybdenum cofactor cytidylyltransferase
MVSILTKKFSNGSPVLPMNTPITSYPLILPAAGKSSRMGTPKGLIDYFGRPWILEQFARFRAAGGEQVVLILGYHQEAYFQEIPWLKDSVDQTIRWHDLEINTIVNAHPGGGQFTSLLCAITSAVIRRAPGAWVLPVDVPGPNPKVYEALKAKLHGPIAVAVPRYLSRGGHPVLLSASFIKTLGAIPPDAPDARLDVQIHRLAPEARVYVPVKDEQVGLNLNTPLDLKGYLGDS